MLGCPNDNPPKSGATPPDWPQAAWQLRLICRECDRWCVDEQDDVLWAHYSSPLAEQSGLDFQCIELECAESGCGSRTRWHVLDNSQLSESELFEFVLRADPVVVCENGHPLSISGVASRSLKRSHSFYPFNPNDLPDRTSQSPNHAPS